MLVKAQKGYSACWRASMLTMARRDLDRALRNLAEGHPLTRLRAVHDLHVMLDETFDRAELELVKKARQRRPPERWESIGNVLGGMTGQHAARKFRDRL